MELHILPDVKILNKSLAKWIADYIKKTLETKPAFSMVLSGGNTPQSLYEELSENQEEYKIDWQRVIVFWGDERVVPFSDKRNNAAMAYDTLLNKVPVLPKNIYRMRTDISPDQSAEEYDQVLHHFFKKSATTFDLVLLGMGDDGHTLSLFPGSAAIGDSTTWVREVYNTDQQMYRITLIPAVVSKAHKIAFMIAGENKATILKNVLKSRYQPARYPSQLFICNRKDVVLFLDHAAAAQIEKEG